MSARVNSPRAREPRRSTRGASLPLVLLLFLICAMASSIVLAAASAAAGRAAGLAESEQLYYSATSAARLFRDEVAGADGRGRTVTVVLSQRLAADGSADGAPALALLRGDGTRVDPLDDCTLLERATLFALFGGDFANVQGAQQWVTGAGDLWGGWVDEFDNAFPGAAFATLNLQHGGTALTAADRTALDVQVRAEIDAEGNLLFRFLEPGADASKDDGVLLTLVCTGEYDPQRMAARGDSPGASAYDVQAITVTWAPSAIERGLGSHAA